MPMPKLEELIPAQKAPPRPICHRLSGFLFKPPSPLAGDQGSAPTMACLGRLCALFVAETDDKGRPLDRGMCGDLVQALALNRIAQYVNEIDMDDEEDAGEEDPPGRDA